MLRYDPGLLRLRHLHDGGGLLLLRDDEQHAGLLLHVRRARERQKQSEPLVAAECSTNSLFSREPHAVGIVRCAAELCLPAVVA